MYAPAFVSAIGLAVVLSAAASPAAAQDARPFTLADAIARAHATTPEAAAALARVDAAREGAAMSGRPPNPVFEFRTENILSGVSRTLLPLDTFAEVTQVVELGGKRSARRAVATAELGSAEARQALTHRALTLDVVSLYLEALRLRNRHAALRLQAADLAELVRIVARRVEVGTTAEADVLRLRAEEARTTAELVRAELAATRALTELAARLDVDAQLEQLQAPILPPLGPEPALDDVLARRPDVAVAARAADTARQVLRLEDARGVPDPAVNAGYKRTMGYHSGLVTFTMAVPIFERNRVARAVARGEVQAADHELAAVTRRARGELLATRTAANRLRTAAEETRMQLLEPARGARDAARAAFQTGALDVMRLLDAERIHADAALVVLDLDLDAVAAAIAARLAAGEEPLP